MLFLRRMSDTISKVTRRQAMAGSLVASSLAISLPSAAKQADSPAPPRALLQQNCSATRLRTLLGSREKFRPYPRASDRAAWKAIPPDAQRALLDRGETALRTPWSTLSATLFMEYARNGNRTHFEHERDLRRNKLQSLVLAECVEDKGRFLDEIANGIWLTCEETFWGLPAHMAMQKAGVGLPDVDEPIIDLFAAETAHLLAWTHYLLDDKLRSVSPLVLPRIQQEVQRRILDPALARNDFSWMGLSTPRTQRRALNNWTPWINSNWLTSVLLLEDQETRRWQAVAKIMQSLDLFIDGYPEDGACDEGPSYWTRAAASLFDCLELLFVATDGKVNVYRHPLIQEMGRYIYRAHIDDDYFLNFGDAPAKVHLPGDLTYRYGKRIEDAQMVQFGAFFAQDKALGLDLSGSLGRTLPALFNLAAVQAAQASQSLVRDVWLPDSQMMATRVRNGSQAGFYLGVKGGINGRSHGHNDAGNFLVFLDGSPVIIDVGVESYTAKTFGPHRYEIWTMQSAFHNLPTVGGVMQQSGPNYRATEVTHRADDRHAEVTMNLAHAYPADAGIRRWMRTLTLDRKSEAIALQEVFELERPSASITLNLMTPCEAHRQAPGILAFPVGDSTAKAVLLNYDATRFEPRIEPIDISDAHLRESWGARIFRVQLKTLRPSAQDTWTFHFHHA